MEEAITKIHPGVAVIIFNKKGQVHPKWLADALEVSSGAFLR